MAEATAIEKMQLLPKMLLQTERDNEKYPGFSVLIPQSPLVPPTAQTKPEASSHYNLENAIRRSHRSAPPPQGDYTEQSEKSEEWI